MSRSRRWATYACEVHALGVAAARRQDGEAAQRTGRVAAERRAPAVRGALAGARVGGAEERHQPAGTGEQQMVEVAGAQMSDLVADHHVARRGVVAAGVEKIREQYDHAAAKELGRQGVEAAARLEQVGLGLAREARRAGELLDAGVELGKLRRSEPHGAAAQVGDEGEVDEEEEEADQRNVGQPDDRDREQRPEPQGDEEHQDEERLLGRPGPDLDRGGRDLRGGSEGGTRRGEGGVGVERDHMSIDTRRRGKPGQRRASAPGRAKRER